MKSPTVNNYQVGFDAGWEIDIFGGVRRSVEAADAGVQAAVNALAQSEQAMAVELISLYKALGGGWEESQAVAMVQEK